MWEIAGWLGALALLAAYALLTHGHLRPTSGGYTVLIVLGSAGLAVNGAAHAAWPSVTLNLLWLLIGITAVAAATRHRRGRERGRPAADVPPRK